MNPFMHVALMWTYHCLQKCSSVSKAKKNTEERMNEKTTGQYSPAF